jgi:hypothetical protein
MTLAVRLDELAAAGLVERHAPSDAAPHRSGGLPRRQRLARADRSARRRSIADYPAPEDGIPDFNVHLFAARPWRRVLRPSVHIGGDFVIPDAAPLPLAQGLLAAEMGMNLQMALGQRVICCSMPRRSSATARRC